MGVLRTDEGLEEENKSLLNLDKGGEKGKQKPR